MHQFVDDVSWTHGKHNFQFGVDYRLIHDNTNTECVLVRFGVLVQPANISTVWRTPARISIPRPIPLLDSPTVATSFNNSYSYAAMNLAGIVASTSLNYVYKVNAAEDRAALARRFVRRSQLQGQPV